MAMHEFLAQDRVIWGEPAREAVLAEVERRAASRIFIVTGKTLNRQTPLIRELSQALGMRYVACFDECMEHTPRRTVIEAARVVRLAKPDLILTVGGGTAIDTVKVLLIALAEGLEHEDELSAWHLAVNPDGSRRIPKVKSPPMRQIAVSTTLSAAEFSNLGGCTDEKRKVKDAYMGTEIGPAAVILDPRATLYTPTWLWLSTGLRALDHAIEGLCSVNPSPLIHALGLEAVRLLSKGLRQSNQHPDDLQARLDCLQGAWLAGIGIMRVPFGASHGIGHSLGAVTGMSHGYTSCIMLPHVMRYNHDKTKFTQSLIAQAMGSTLDAPDAVARLVEELGLPSRLRDLQVKPEQFDAVAAGAIDNLWVKTNPEPITKQAQIHGLLAKAW